MEREVRVTVWTLNGGLLDIDVEPDTTVLKLKNEIAEQMSVPIIFQSLFSTIEADELKDNDPIVHQRYQLVISLAKAQEKLDCHQGQIDVLQDLRKLGLRGGVQAVAAVCGCLEDTDVTVRIAAVEAMAQVVEKGDQHAIDAVIGRMEHAAGYIRGAAVMALATVAEKGDQHAVAALIRRLDDADLSVRNAAVEALAHFPEKGDVHALAALIGRLEDADGAVRQAAVKALAHVAEKGDQHAFAAEKGDDHSVVVPSLGGPAQFAIY